MLDVLLAPGFLDGVARKGQALWDGMAALKRDFPTVFEEHRGAGLLQGLKCVGPVGTVQEACTAEGLMTITAGDNTLRIAPPLVVTDADIAEGLRLMRRAAEVCAGESKAAAQ